MTCKYPKILYIIIILIFSHVLIQNTNAFQQMKSYTVADGLLDSVVPVIFQDSRGMLWFGSEHGGVSRFDGKTIVAFGATSENFYGRTQKIVEDRWGHIWFLSKNPARETGVIIRYNGDTFEYFADGNCLTSDKEGNIWVGSRNNITRFSATSSQDIPKGLQLDISNASIAKINVIFQSQDNAIWVGGKDEQGVFIVRLQGDIVVGQAVDIKHFDNLPSLPNDFAVDDIAQDTDGNLWFAGKSILLRYDSTQFEKITDSSLETHPNNKAHHAPDILEKDTVSVKSDKHGRIWYNVNTHLFWSDGKTLNKLRKLSLEANQDGYLQGSFGVEDAMGRLWFASNTGVHLYENTNNSDAGVSHPQLESLLTDSPELTHKIFQVNHGLGSNNVLTIFEAIDGTIWFGHDNGVTALQPQPAIVQYGTRSILGSSNVKLMFPDSMGTLWLSIPGGVARYVPKEDELYKYPLADLVLDDGNGKKQRSNRPTEIVKIFEIDEDLWFLDKTVQHQDGFTLYRIFRYRNGVFEELSIQIRAKNGIDGEPNFGNPEPLVSSGTEPWMALNGWLFLPRKNGLHRILPDGSTRRIAYETITSLPTPPNTISTFHTDSQNRLWCYSETGEVKRYTIITNSNNQPVGKIHDEVLPIRSVIPISSLHKDSPIRWLYNTESKKLIYWENLDLTKPAIELPNTHVTPPLLVVQTATVASELQQENLDKPKNTNFSLTTFVFEDSIKTYDGTTLMYEVSVELGKLRNALVASDGVLWLATSKGAVQYNGKGVKTYTKIDGFIVDDLRDVKEDNWGNIWFATWGGGLIRYNGDTFESITTKDGLIHNNVSSIHFSNEEDLWFGTEGGATQYRVSRGALPFCRIISVHTGESNPETIRMNATIHNATEITELLPARLKNLTIRFQGISPLGGNVSYKFRILGIDNNEWTTITPENKQGHSKTFIEGVKQYYQPPEGTSSSGFPQIRYEGLKSGKYTFLITAFREGWPYAQQPSVLNFTIDKPIWTRWRTYLPYIIIFATMGSLLFRLIINRRQTAQLRLEMQEKEEAEMQRIRDELSEAQNIQMGLLPTEVPHTQTYDIAGRSIPATQVGGDFYDYLTVANGQTAIAVADAAGKGIRGAMSAVLTNGMLYEVARIKSEANVILQELNAGLAPRMYGRNFIALNLAILNETEKTVNYANGGQPFPIHKRGTNITEIDCSDLPLGSMKNVDYASVTFDLEVGDFLIIHSDGLIEALNPDQEMYGADRLIDLTANVSNECSAEEMLQQIVDDIQAFVLDAEQYDDLTLVVVKCITPSE